MLLGVHGRCGARKHCVAYGGAVVQKLVSVATVLAMCAGVVVHAGYEVHERLAAYAGSAVHAGRAVYTYSVAYAVTAATPAAS